MDKRAPELLKHFPNVFLSGLILTIPFSPKWNNYFLILVGVVALLIFTRQQKLYSLPAFLYFLMAAYVVRVVWLIPAGNLRYGLKTLETELPLFALPLLFIFLKLDSNSRKFLTDAFVCMAFLMMAYSFAELFHYIAVSEYTIWNYWETHFVTAQYYSMLNMFSWSFVHYSFLSLIAIYGLNLVIFRENKTKLHVLFSCVYALVTWLFVVAAGSLAGLVIMVICYLAYTLIFVYKKWGLKPVTGIILILSICTITFLSRFNLQERLSQLDPQRYQLFMVGWSAWTEKPFFGYGTGSQKEILQNIDKAQELGFSIENYPGPLVNHPHNQFLTDLLQFGLIGSIPLFMSIALALISGLRHENWILLVTMLTVSASMAVESPINSNKGLVPFMLLLCILANGQRVLKRRK